MLLLAKSVLTSLFSISTLLLEGTKIVVLVEAILEEENHTLNLFDQNQISKTEHLCLRPQSYKDFTIIKEKIQSAAVQFFSLSKTTTTNPNHRNCVFYILHTRFTMSYKRTKKFSQERCLRTPRRLVHEHCGPKPQKISH